MANTSKCLITQRISGLCYSCSTQVEGAHVNSGEGGLARILCQKCCPEHGQPGVHHHRPEPPMFTGQV